MFPAFSRAILAAAAGCGIACTALPVAATQTGGVARGAAGETAGGAKGVMGPWLDQAKRAAIDIEPCQGNSVCGTITWLKEPLNAQGQPKVDVNNQRAELQGRRVCGLMMIYGFSPDGSGGWKDGYIYDPSSGKTYNSQFHVQADGTLYVRGYIGYSWLGETQTWTRPSGSLPHCS